MDLKELRRTLSNLEKDDILKVFGVEERRSTGEVLLPALGLFGVGVLVGAGIGLLLAPKSGRELRDELRTHLQPPGEAPRPESSPAPGVARSA